MAEEFRADGVRLLIGAQRSGCGPAAGGGLRVEGRGRELLPPPRDRPPRGAPRPRQEQIRQRGRRASGADRAHVDGLRAPGVGEGRLDYADAVGRAGAYTPSAAQSQKQLSFRWSSNQPRTTRGPSVGTECSSLSRRPATGFGQRRRALGEGFARARRGHAGVGDGEDHAVGAHAGVGGAGVARTGVGGGGGVDRLFVGGLVVAGTRVGAARSADSPPQRRRERPEPRFCASAHHAHFCEADKARSAAGPKPGANLHEDPPEHVLARPVTAVAPEAVVLGALDEASVAGRRE